MTSLGPGRTNVFVLGADHSVYWKYGGKKIWTNYHHNAGGKWRYAPVTVSRVHNELSLFTVAANGSMYQSNFDLVNEGDLGRWKNLGGTLDGPPAVARRGEAGVHIFYIGSTDHALYHKFWDGLIYTPAEGYERLEGDFGSHITAVSEGLEEVSVFAIGREGHRLYRYHWHSSTGWSPVEKLPGTAWGESLKCVSDNPGFVDVFGVNIDGKINHVHCEDGTNWTLLEALTGQFRQLDAISTNPGVIEILALTDHHTIFHRSLKSGSWTAWEDLKGIMMLPPKAVSQDHGWLGLFCVGTNRRLYYKYRDEHSGSWSIWVDLGGSLTTGAA